MQRLRGPGAPRSAARPPSAPTSAPLARLLPGPRGLPFLGPLHRYLGTQQFFKVITEWTQQYGPVSAGRGARGGHRAVAGAVATRLPQCMRSNPRRSQHACWFAALQPAPGLLF